MELIYIWVKKYKNIKNQGFNFSPNHEFKFIENENYELKDSFEGKKQPKNFFDENLKIKNITAIIGANGSGKSSILEVICDTLDYLKSTGEEKVTKKLPGSLMVFKNHEEKFYIFNKCECIKNKLKLYIKNEPIEFSKLDTLEAQFLYYDPMFARKYKKRNEYYSNEVDISLQNILMNEGNNDLYDFATVESRKAFKFLTTYGKRGKLEKSLEITLPKFQYISLKSLGSENNSIEDFKKELLKNVFFEIKKEIGETSLEDDNKIKDILKDCQEKNIDEIIERLTRENTKREIIDLLKRKEKKYFNYIKYFNENVFKMIKNNAPGIEFQEGKIKIKLGFKNKDTRKKVLEFIEKDKLGKNLLNYNYDIELSGGERAILNLFSNFYDIKESNGMNNNDKDDNIIILMDEPDSLLHPEWQRRFLSVFIEFVEELFKTVNRQTKVKKVQIITTSHSPFIASDLPKENVIMLKSYSDKDSEVKLNENDKSYQEVGNCKIDIDKIVSTFGANIFDLYKDGFSVTSTFGDFSKRKIESILDSIEKNDISNKESEIEYTINLIGEKLIKSQLLERYEKSKKKSLHKLDEKMLNYFKSLSLEKKEEFLSSHGIIGEVND